MINREFILEIFTWFSNAMTKTLQFDEWKGGSLEIYGSSRFGLCKSLQNHQKYLKDSIDWTDLSISDCEFLGFTKCFPNENGIDEELAKKDLSLKEREMLMNMKKLWIIPGYLLPIIPGRGIDMYTTSGDKVLLEPLNADGTISTEALKKVCGNIGIIPTDS